MTLALVLVVMAVALLALSWRLRRTAGVSDGSVIYSDSGALRRNPRALYAPRYQLAGKPDYLLRTPRGIVPLELKSTPAPPAPYRGHRLQLAAYCLLVEEHFGQAPPYGIIRYADAEFQIAYDARLKAELLEALQSIRQALAQADAHRDHAEPMRCARCAARDVCDERLA